jgi:acyl-CoA thioesterase II
MSDADARLPPWDEHDLAGLLTLDEVAPLRYRNRYGDSNLNGRSYGGQVLGQTMMAAAMSVPPDRNATMLQFLFLQGTNPERAVDFEVTVLQDGKRFSSRHVRGTQAGRVVLDANATFAVAVPAPRHSDPLPDFGPVPPEALATLDDMPTEWAPGLRKLGGYSMRGKASIDFRVPDFEQQVNPENATSRLRFWMKAKRELPTDGAMQASAIAYLSDWWLNFSSLAAHVRELPGEEKLYISSLNHCIWFHRPFRADEWMYFDSQSPNAEGGRGFSIAKVHDRNGVLVASATQECLMAFA